MTYRFLTKCFYTYHPSFWMAASPKFLPSEISVLQYQLELQEHSCSKIIHVIGKDIGESLYATVLP